MTNYELRLAIAKAKGIKYWIAEGGEYVGRFDYADAGEVFVSKLEGCYSDRLPNWPEDAADAMTLMQEAADQNVYVTLFYSRHDRKWVARFHRTQTTAHADTLERAVSEAYYNWQTMEAA